MPSRVAKRRLLSAATAAVVAVLALGSVGRAEVAATHDTVINFDSRIFPHRLPRHGGAPVGIEMVAHLKPRSRHEPTALTGIELAIHRAARISEAGIPICDISQIDPASTLQALAVCGGAKIGYGRIQARSRFPGTRQFHIDARVTVFNGRLENGRRAILLHVFNPVLRSSYVFPLTITHRAGRYRTVLTAHVRVGRWSSVTGFKLVLGRSPGARGSRHSFLDASCPAPRGLSFGVSPFVVAVLHFADKTQTRIGVVGSCQVDHRGRGR